MNRPIISALMLALICSVLSACDRNTEERGVTEHREKVLPYGKVTKYGLFRERGRGWVQDDASSSTGKTIRGATLEFEGAETRRIPLRKGIHFGYRYWLKFPPDQQEISFRRVLIHPEMQLPDGSKVRQSQRGIKKASTHGVVTSIDAYALTEEYELVAGQWVFQLWYDNKMLAEQIFTTYWPEDSTASTIKPGS